MWTQPRFLCLWLKCSFLQCKYSVCNITYSKNQFQNNWANLIRRPFRHATFSFVHVLFVVVLSHFIFKDASMMTSGEQSILRGRHMVIGTVHVIKIHNCSLQGIAYRAQPLSIHSRRESHKNLIRGGGRMRFLRFFKPSLLRRVKKGKILREK